MSLVKKRFLTPLLLLSAVLGYGQVISEFMASNSTNLPTADGLYEDWIEIHNTSGQTLDLTGWYLTDDPTDLRKWRIPSTAATSPLAPNGHFLVFADSSDLSVVGGELHANFKLSAGGEYLALVNSDGETVAHQYSPVFPDQTTDISYGLDSISGEPTYFAVPTPGTANGQGIADAVQFSATSGTFTNAFSLTLSVTSPTASIRYTMSGTLPTTNSTLYTGAIPISSTTRIRAQAFDPGRSAGPVRSESFIHLTASAAAFTSDLPLVILENFGAGEIPATTNLPPYQQFSQVMFMEPVDGICRLTEAPSVASRAGIKRRGESTLRRSSSKPSLSLESWGEIDGKGLSIKPLGLPAESDWILHAPWSIDTAMMRNSFLYEVSNEAGRYAPRTRFVEVFLNYNGGSLSASDYCGVYVLMEKIKIGPDRVDIAALSPAAGTEPDISGGYLWKLDKSEAEGTNDVNNFAAADKLLAYSYTNSNGNIILSQGLQFVSPSGAELTATQKSWLINRINTVDAAIPDGNYAAFIDVGAFADHHVLNLFAQNADGLRISTFFFKDRNGLINMGPIWDFDRSMGCDNDARPSNPLVWGMATNTSYFFETIESLWFPALAAGSPDFWMEWTDRWQAIRDGPLNDANISMRIEGYRTKISAAAARNYTRWTFTNCPNPAAWTGKVDSFKNHALTRAHWIDDQLVDPPAFNQAGGLVSSGFQFTLTGPNIKYYTLNGSDPRASGGAPAGTAYSSPVLITQNTLVKARAWDGTTFTQVPDTWPWSPLSEAMFVVTPAPLAITEIMYHPRPPSGTNYSTSDFEFIEIQNTSGASCQLVGVKFLDGVKFDFTYGNAATLGAGAYGVVVANLDAFKLRYTNWPSLNILGTFTGKLSNSSEKLKLGYAPTNMLPLASFDYEADWYPCTDGEGFSLVLNDPQSDPATWDSKAAWRYSSAIDGTPGEANPAPAYPVGAVVINEVLSHQDNDDPGDWIELRNTTGSSINIGGWFLSDSRGALTKYAIPAGITVPANGYLVLTEHDHFGAAFSLSEFGDSVYLSAGSGGNLAVPAYRASESFGGQERNVTFGRYVKSDGSSDFPAMASVTMGTSNSAPRVGPVVIDEIMYNPLYGGDEYLRLKNISGAIVPLYDPSNPSNTWKVSGIDFDFPQGVELGIGDTLILVRDTTTAAAFRTAFSIPGSIDIFNYSGALDNDKDTVVLEKPDEPEAATGYVKYITVEQVKYNDRVPWPEEADGNGKALGRINTATYADDVVNWQAVVPAYATIPLTYLLTVNSGSGDGTYAAGMAVPISADAAGSGRAFSKWAGNTSAVSTVTSAFTTLTMPPRDVTVTAAYASNTTLVAQGSVWKYHDLGTNLYTAWREPGYNDSTWEGGEAELGYGDGDENTVVGYGPDSDNKYITTYFRKSFTVANASAVTSLTLHLLRDDGAVVYLNGTEVVRDNMPTGTITYQTVASSAVNDANETIFFTFSLPSTGLVSGTNVLAIEIHQRAATSSDLGMNAQLDGFVANPVLDGDADGMADAWETAQFGSTENGLPAMDSDADGQSNLAEYIAGTQPTNAASLFLIDWISSAGIEWTASTGRVYSILWTSNLLSQPFVEIASGLTQSNFTDNVHTNGNANYYRINVELE